LYGGIGRPHGSDHPGALPSKAASRLVRGTGEGTFAVPRRPTRGRSLIRGRRGLDLEAPPFSSRGQDLNLRPLGYEPSELPDCSTPHTQDSDANRR
jgi:hypothetical protein